MEINRYQRQVCARLGCSYLGLVGRFGGALRVRRVVAGVVSGVARHRLRRVFVRPFFLALVLNRLQVQSTVNRASNTT